MEAEGRSGKLSDQSEVLLHCSVANSNSESFMSSEYNHQHNYTSRLAVSTANKVLSSEIQKHDNHLSCGHFMEWNMENTERLCTSSLVSRHCS